MYCRSRDENKRCNVDAMYHKRVTNRWSCVFPITIVFIQHTVYRLFRDFFTDILTAKIWFIKYIIDCVGFYKVSAIFSHNGGSLIQVQHVLYFKLNSFYLVMYTISKSYTSNMTWLIVSASHFKVCKINNNWIWVASVVVVNLSYFHPFLKPHYVNFNHTSSLEN